MCKCPSNTRQISSSLNQVTLRDTSTDTFQCQKKSRLVQGIQGIPEPWGTLKGTMELHASPSHFSSPPTKGAPPVILEIPQPPNKAKFQIFQPPPPS